MRTTTSPQANPYPDLPDVLRLKNGKRVTKAKVWWTKRRPEIVEDFEREVVGRVPKNRAESYVDRRGIRKYARWARAQCWEGSSSGMWTILPTRRSMSIFK